MSRRDTILVAVLINAGLLIVLFASALKSTPQIKECELSYKPAAAETSMKKEHPVSGGDEVDQALSQFANMSSTKYETEKSGQSYTSPSDLQGMPMVSGQVQMTNFTSDLKAITLPEAANAAPSYSPSVQTAFTPALSQEEKKSDPINVRVKKGDVLEKIARHHHTTVEEIVKLNQLSSTHLRIGQILKIPGKKSTASEISVAKPLTVSSTSSNESTPKYYTVKNGDNPWTIAVKNHMKVEELLKLNNLDEEKARRLKPGDQLRIR